MLNIKVYIKIKLNILFFKILSPILKKLALSRDTLGYGN